MLYCQANLPRSKLILAFSNAILEIICKLHAFTQHRIREEECHVGNSKKQKTQA